MDGFVIRDTHKLIAKLQQRGFSAQQAPAEMLEPRQLKQARPSTFEALDKMIRRRLRSLLMKQNKLSHFGFGHSLHRRWPNAYFANAGLFALHTAWQTARRSR